MSPHEGDVIIAKKTAGIVCQRILLGFTAYCAGSSNSRASHCYTISRGTKAL